VITSVAAGVVVLDAELTVKCWNRGAFDLWGLRAEEVLDRPFFGLDFGLAVERLREVVESCLESGERTGPVRVSSLSRLGRTIVCAVTCSPFDGHTGGVVLLMEESEQPDDEDAG
jgi:two-component system CheB/CheR fusion protein